MSVSTLLFACSLFGAVDLDTGPQVRAAAPLALKSPLVEADPESGLWARTGTWKLHATRDGFTFYPLVKGLGRHSPLSFHTPSMTLGGSALASDDDLAPVVDGGSFVQDHGSFVERWNLELDRVEQTFEIPSLAKRGEIVIDLPIDTAWTYRGHDGGLRFDVEGKGEAVYGDVTTRDARGREVKSSSEFLGDRIRLHVPEAFVRDATLPLVVDPVLQFITIESGATFNVFDAKTAYDATSDTYVVVFHDDDEYNPDPDTIGFYLDGNGNVITSLPIDITTSTSRDPSVGDIASTGFFLIAYEFDGGVLSGNKIKVRFVAASNGAVGAAMTLASGNYCNNPHVAGIESPGFNYGLVVYAEGNLLNDATKLQARTISNLGVIGLGGTVADNGAYYFADVTATDAGAKRWIVAYADNSNSPAVTLNARVIDAVSGLGTGSSVLLGNATGKISDMSVAGDGINYVAMWNRYITTSNISDIQVRKMKFSNGALATDGVMTNFSLLDHPNVNSFDVEPHLARDGGRYVYCYSRESLDVTMGTFLTTSSGFQMLEHNLSTPTPSGHGYAADVTTAYESGGPVGKSLVTWLVNDASNFDLAAAFYQSAVLPGGVQVSQTGCGGIFEPKISFTGQLSLVGGTGTVNVTKVANFGSPKILVGTPFSWGICAACTYGVAPTNVIVGSSATIVNGTSPALVGTQIAIQGVVENVLIGTSCTTLTGSTTFQTTDTLIVTLQ